MKRRGGALDCSWNSAMSHPIQRQRQAKAAESPWPKWAADTASKLHCRPRATADGAAGIGRNGERDKKQLTATWDGSYCAGATGLKSNP